jgi:hypothetical protein
VQHFRRVRGGVIARNSRIHRGAAEGGEGVATSSFLLIIGQKVSLGRRLLLCALIDNGQCLQHECLL